MSPVAALNDCTPAPAAPLFVVRHGESTWNADGIAQGQAVHPVLTARGRAEALGAARWLRVRTGGMRPVVISSDLDRARETAAIVRQVLGAEDGGALPFLRERALGSLTGHSRASVDAVLARTADDEVPAPGAESWEEVRRRMAAALHGLDLGTTWVVVGHGDALSAVLADCRGCAPRRNVLRGGEVTRLERTRPNFCAHHSTSVTLQP